MLNFLLPKSENDLNIVEYTTYIYYNQVDDSLPKWEKTGITHSAKHAVQHAKLLCKKQDCVKVEIRKHFFSAHKQKRVGKMYKTYHPKHILWASYIQQMTKPLESLTDHEQGKH